MMESILEKCGLQSCHSSAYLGYSWKNDHSVEAFVSYCPATRLPIAGVSRCSKEDYAKVLEGSVRAFEKWRVTPAPVRGALIRQIGERLREKKHDLALLIALEMGKIYEEALGEVQEMIDMADFCVGQSRMLYGKTMHSERAEHRMYEQWHPLGVIAVITAFNFPVAVWAWNAFLSAICGNVTIWKPSSKVPLSAIAVYECCKHVLEENNAPDIFSLLLTDDHAISSMLWDDNRIPLVSFTGSTAIGKKVAERVSSRLGQTILELGGNNAMIVDETADLDLAIPSVLFSAIGTTGQRCTSLRRLIVHENCLSTVLQKLKNAYAQLKIGNPLDRSTHVGPLIDEPAVVAFEKAIAEGTALGGKIEIGGQTALKNGFFVEPTIFTHISHDSELIKKEIFAPILFVFSYKKFEDAILLQNQVPQGLSSALFTQNLRHAELFLSCLGSDCGIANVNIGTIGAEIGGAFGGEKQTGRGRESGSDAWKVYMRRQTNTIHWGTHLSFAQGIQFSLK